VDVSSGDVNLQLRTMLQSTTAAAVDPWDDFQLQWEKNGNGTWADVATTTVVPYDSPNLTDAAPTTNRLTGGTGAFTAGKVSEDGLVDDLGWAGNNHTELLYSLTLKSADLTNGDTLRFRVLRNGATTGLTYTQTPTINITKTGGAPAYGAITLRGSASNFDNSFVVTSVSVTIPAATQVGDLIIITGTVNSGSRVPTLPSGWTLGQDVPTTSGYDLIWGWRIAQAGDAGRSVAVTYNATGYDIAATCLVFAGVNQATPFGSTPMYAQNTFTGQPHTFPTVASVPAGCRELLLFGHSDVALGSIVLGAAPTGTTLIRNNVGSGGVAQSSAWSDAVVSGTVGGRSWTITTGAGVGSGHTIALLPVTTAPTTTTFDRWNGTAWVPLQVQVWTGSAWEDKQIDRWNGTAWESV